jgi:hypothetical protein
MGGNKMKKRVQAIITGFFLVCAFTAGAQDIQVGEENITVRANTTTSAYFDNGRGKIEIEA